MSLTELLHEWHDFYLLLGTASATLVGLMFVAASIGTTVFNEKHRAALEAFISPTVVHFAAVLFACLVIMMPIHDWESLGALLGIGGLAGLIYTGRVVLQLNIRHRFNVELIDGCSMRSSRWPATCSRSRRRCWASCTSRRART